MKIYFDTAKKVVFEEENILLTLSKEEVEDIINAMEVDNSSLYLLINDTIINEAQGRITFRNLVRKVGGIEKGIDEIRFKLKDFQMKFEEEKKKEEELKKKGEEEKKKLEEKKTSATADKSSPPKVQTTANKPSDSALRKALSAEIPGKDTQLRFVNKTTIQGKNFVVKWLNNGDVEVFCDENIFKISKDKFIKLRKDMPSDTSGMFQVMLRDILEGQENKVAFRKIMSTLGSSNFLSTLKIELEKIK